MRNVVIKKVIAKCELTGDQLELYGEDDAQDIAANTINAAILEYGNDDTLSLGQKINAVYGVMKTLANVGACDSEPLYVVERVLTEASA